MVDSVLIVDDSRLARFALKRTLEKKNLRVDVAESAEDAINYLKSNHPDLVFMDHMMPGMDGLQATEAISTNPNTAKIPVVMCSSKDDPEFHRLAAEMGAYKVLPKPAPEELVSQVLEQVSKDSKVFAEKSAFALAQAQNQLDDRMLSAAANESTQVVVDTEEIEKIAVATAERIVLARVNSLADHVVENKLGQLKQTLKEELLTLFEEATNDSDALLEGRVGEVVESTMTSYEKQLRVMMREVAREEIAQRIDEFQIETRRQIDSMNDRMRKSTAAMKNDIAKAAVLDESARKQIHDISLEAARAVMSHGDQAFSKNPELLKLINDNAQLAARKVCDDALGDDVLQRMASMNEDVNLKPIYMGLAVVGGLSVVALLVTLFA